MHFAVCQCTYCVFVCVCVHVCVYVHVCVCVCVLCVCVCYSECVLIDTTFLVPAGPGPTYPPFLSCLAAALSCNCCN